MTERTCLDVAADAIEQRDGEDYEAVARAALDAIHPTLARITPEQFRELLRWAAYGLTGIDPEESFEHDWQYDLANWLDEEIVAVTDLAAEGDPEVRDMRRRWPNCTCPYGIRPLGVLYGINMGKGLVRLSTDPECPHHGGKDR